jgi:hydroxymethylpyrimidine/phosphomethylpyrimidine kinase
VEPGKRPIALTIAGSDSGGGAGIQGDLKTFAAHRVFGTSVVVAVTAQNTLGVRAVHPIPGEVVQAQLDAVAEDLPPQAVKTGMLATRELVLLVAEALATRQWSNYVLDPVMVSSSGARLLTDDAMEAVRHHLVPLALCITPNLHEAEMLTGLPVHDPATMVAAGEALLAMGARNALIKGGHLESDILVDILVTPDGVERFSQSRLLTRSTHGTGCALSAAITAWLARDVPINEAVELALGYVQDAIRNAPGLGGGIGPLWHGVEEESE